jgi:hypothetical protein
MSRSILGEGKVKIELMAAYRGALPVVSRSGVMYAARDLNRIGLGDVARAA